MLAVLVLEPDAPLLVQEFALVFALIPVLRLLPAGMLRALGVWPYVAVALYALDRLALAAVADAALYRLFLLALNVLALGLTIWLLRHPVSTTTPHDTTLQRAVRPWDGPHWRCWRWLRPATSLAMSLWRRCSRVA